MTSLPSRSLSLTALTALALGGLVACEDVAQPFELSHARVLAVRTAPAQLAPGAAGEVQALFTDGTAPPQLATAAALEVRMPPAFDRPELASIISSDERGWYVHAPDEAVLRELRRVLGVAEGAPVAFPIDVRVDTAAGPLDAQKLVWLGAHADNPPAPEPRLDGMAMEEGGRVAARAEQEITLELVGIAPGTTVRWFTSRGELTRYTQAAARWTLSAEDLEGPATVAAVIRTEAGGVAWVVRSVTFSASPSG